MNSNSSHDAETILRQALLALAANRTPGFHFPGHLLGCHWPRIGEDDLDAAMPDGPQARNVDGTVSLAGLCVLLDVALATAARLRAPNIMKHACVASQNC